MKTSICFASVVLLISAMVATATAIPPGSILVSTRTNAAGIVALDLDGNVVVREFIDVCISNDLVAQSKMPKNRASRWKPSVHWLCRPQ